ncbi:MAG: 16S rRNA (cytidine(1402)-2'-O)-methyltransferase [Proteobacteria bacterium]|nr:16S rRNA (cytidine(1402)-2'-O)-methyltransferase [Pseudomonadota bacterium]
MTDSRTKDPKGPGVLYVVATPLGNLEDLTFRAVRILGEVDMVLAEDTRRTRKLLTHYGLNVFCLSYREQNHARVLPKILDHLENGRHAALVSDAGTPGLSDPGAPLVREVVRRNLPVVPIPGVSAPAVALSVSGLPAESYVFVGYLPARPADRRRTLEAVRAESRTLVLFEAPHRLASSLEDLESVLGDREAVLAREMTKINEEFIRGRLSEIAGRACGREGRVKGEVTMVVAGADSRAAEGLTRRELEEIIQGDDRPVREIAADLSESSGMSRSDLYRLILDVTGRRG